MSNRNYADMLDLPHPVSSTHAPMSLIDRAAQFSPFSALVGYEEIVAEAARLTECRIEISEEARETLRRQLTRLRERLSDRPLVTLRYFLPDGRKSGGEERTLTARILGMDELNGLLLLEGGRKIPMEDLYALSGDEPEAWE